MINLSNDFVLDEKIFFYEAANVRALGFIIRRAGRFVFFRRRRHSALPVSGDGA